MNKAWIRDSYKSAELFRRGHHERDKKLQLVRILDMAGMFETSWIVFDHSLSSSRYGYPI